MVLCAGLAGCLWFLVLPADKKRRGWWRSSLKTAACCWSTLNVPANVYKVSCALMVDRRLILSRQLLHRQNVYARIQDILLVHAQDLLPMFAERVRGLCHGTVLPRLCLWPPLWPQCARLAPGAARPAYKMVSISEDAACRCKGGWQRRSHGMKKLRCWLTASCKLRRSCTFRVESFCKKLCHKHRGWLSWVCQEHPYGQMTAAAHKAEGLWEPRKLGTCHARICAPCRRRAYARAALGQCTELTRENAWAWMCLPAPARAPYVNEHFLRIKPLLILLLAEFDETLHARFTRLCFDMRAYIGTLDTNVQCVGIEAKGSETRRNASITCCCAGQPQSYPKHPAPNLRGPAALWTPSRQHRARRSAVAHKGLLRGARSFARPSWGPGRVFGRSCSLCLACTTGRASRNRRCVRDSTETAQWMCRGACRLSNGQIGAGTSSSGLLIVRTMGRNRRKAGATCEDWRGRFVQGPSRRIVLPAFRVRGRRHARSRRKRMERTATHRAARGADRRCVCPTCHVRRAHACRIRHSTVQGWQGRTPAPWPSAGCAHVASRKMCGGCEGVHNTTSRHHKVYEWRHGRSGVRTRACAGPAVAGSSDGMCEARQRRTVQTPRPSPTHWTRRDLTQQTVRNKGDVPLLARYGLGPTWLDLLSWPIVFVAKAEVARCHHWYSGGMKCR